MQRLGKNKGRYHGEQIDIDRVLMEFHQLAGKLGWTSETFLDDPVAVLRSYSRQVPNPRKNIYISSGVHGDEPSGPLALLELLQENRWPDDMNLWLVPCVNPTGFRQNTRENALGIDLNRDYRHLNTVEVQAHVRWLEQLPDFDLTILLHEDWEANGFYVYELNRGNLPGQAELLIESICKICPIETATLVDDWECRGGIIRPQIDPMDRPQWAEALYLGVHKTPQSYTLETPSDFPLPLRVKAHTHAVRTILERV